VHGHSLSCFCSIGYLGYDAVTLQCLISIMYVWYCIVRRDLWSYNISTSIYTWVWGSNILTPAPSYGTLRGTPVHRATLALSRFLYQYLGLGMVDRSLVIHRVLVHICPCVLIPLAIYGCKYHTIHTQTAK
jgi:hypothetical protein